MKRANADFKPQHVAKWGVELEGAWNHEPADSRRLVDDCSVRCCGSYRSGAEYRSRILRTWSATCTAVRENYPDVVDGSCGMHVHMSFHHREEIVFLGDSERYQDYLLMKLRRWGVRAAIKNPHFWSRLEGRNSFCQLSWNPRRLVDPGCGDDRYRVVNFSAFHRHGTVEVRVLPMFRNREIALNAIRVVLSATDRYLDRYSSLGRGCFSRVSMPLSKLEPLVEELFGTVPSEPETIEVV